MPKQPVGMRAFAPGVIERYRKQQRYAAWFWRIAFVCLIVFWGGVAYGLFTR